MNPNSDGNKALKKEGFKEPQSIATDKNQFFKQSKNGGATGGTCLVAVDTDKEGATSGQKEQDSEQKEGGDQEQIYEGGDTEKTPAQV